MKTMRESLDALAEIVGTLTAWLHTTLGETATRQLLDRVGALRDEMQPQPTGGSAPSQDEVGQLIRTKRRALRLTIHDLGKAAGVSSAFISDLENGKRGVGLDTFLSLAGALKVDLWGLIADQFEICNDSPRAAGGKNAD